MERGRHADLLDRGGVYAALLRRQILTEDLERDAPSHAARVTIQRAPMSARR